MLAVPDGSERALSAMVVADAYGACQPNTGSHRADHLRDRTISEAAEILGIPPGTVKSRLYYGIRALRVLLRDKGVAG